NSETLAFFVSFLGLRFRGCIYTRPKKPGRMWGASVYKGAHPGRQQKNSLAQGGRRAAAVIDRGAAEAREDPVYLLQACPGLHGAGRGGGVAHSGAMLG